MTRGVQSRRRVTEALAPVSHARVSDEAASHARGSTARREGRRARREREHDRAIGTLSGGERRRESEVLAETRRRAKMNFLALPHSSRLPMFTLRECRRLPVKGPDNNPEHNFAANSHFAANSLRRRCTPPGSKVTPQHCPGAWNARRARASISRHSSRANELDAT